jgi:tetratricopeptide (TPR) repeat protein
MNVTCKSCGASSESDNPLFFKCDYCGTKNVDESYLKSMAANAVKKTVESKSYELGLVSIQAGDFDNAEKQLELAIHEIQSDPELWIYYAFCKAALVKPSNYKTNISVANEALKKAFSLSDSNNDIVSNGIELVGERFLSATLSTLNYYYDTAIKKFIAFGEDSSARKSAINELTGGLDAVNDFLDLTVNNAPLQISASVFTYVKLSMFEKFCGYDGYITEYKNKIRYNLSLLQDKHNDLLQYVINKYDKKYTKGLFGNVVSSSIGVKKTILTTVILGLLFVGYSYNSKENDTNNSVTSSSISTNSNINDFDESNVEHLAFYDLFGVKGGGKPVNTPNDQLSQLWFSKRFLHGNIWYTVVFIKSQKLIDNKVDDCHACGVNISTATYKKVADKWELVVKQSDFAEVGSYGNAPDVSAEGPETINLSPSTAVLKIDTGYSGMGESTNGFLLFVFKNGRWEQPGFIVTEENNSGDCSNTDPDAHKCWGYKGNFSIVGSAKEYPDIFVKSVGTISNDNGLPVNAPDKLYVFSNGSYELKKVVANLENILPPNSVVDQPVAVRPTPLTLNSNIFESNKNLLNMFNSFDDTNKIDFYKNLIDSATKPTKGDRKNARLLNDKGLTQIKSGDLSNAIQLLISAHETDPSDVEIINNLASAYNQNKDWKSAIRYSVEALSIKPDRTYAWDDLGRALVMEYGMDSGALNAFVISYHYSKNQPKKLAYYSTPADFEEPEVKAVMQKTFNYLNK